MCSKRCNSNDAISVFEILARELRATLLSNLSSRGLRGLTAAHVGGGGARPDHTRRRPIGGRREACGAWPGHSQRRPIGGRREACGAWPGHSQRRPIGGRREACGAWLQCPRAVAGPGRASRRRAERSSQRGRRAGGPPPTGTPSSPAQQARPRPEIWRHRDKKVVAPRKTWGPPLMRSLA